MDDTKLVRLVLLVSIIGLSLLAIGVALREPQPVAIEELSLSNQGEYVTVTGVVRDVTLKNSHLFFNVVDGTGALRVVFFKNDIERQGFDRYTLVDGNEIAINGRIELYRGSLELVAERVSLV